MFNFHIRVHKGKSLFCSTYFGCLRLLSIILYSTFHEVVLVTVFVSATLSDSCICFLVMGL